LTSPLNASSYDSHYSCCDTEFPESVVLVFVSTARIDKDVKALAKAGAFFMK
jgi:hypothetical protein